jgi:uncharacterized protein YecE (DUF72 family)
MARGPHCRESRPRSVEITARSGPVGLAKVIWCVTVQPRMITVGCSGFAVPATRYFREYEFVEVQETHRAVPGPGTIRRWRREAPDGFQFALLGPREIAQESFRSGKVIETALKSLELVQEELHAQVAIFLATADFSCSRPNRSALKDFLVAVCSRFGTVVFDAGPAWNPEEADELAEETRTLAVRDPLQHGLSKRVQAYYRLPGPAGHKSRYEDPAIERLAEIAKEATHEHAHYVFTNVDMFADGRRFKRAVGL